MINGLQLRDAIISAANNISNQRQLVDSLNVFPVPDGDTGTNMSMTINAAKRELERMGSDVTVTEAANAAAASLLRGARGNSGVILSLLFRGFAKGLAGKESARARDIVTALSMGVDAAYKAVMKPTEGTILTVARLAAEHSRRLLNESDPENVELRAVWEEIVKSAGEALELTPEMLPVLKKAGVVDAGGKGLVFIFQGMASVFSGNGIIRLAQEAPSTGREEAFGDAFVNAAGAYDGEITHTYCTEFIINQERSQDVLALRAYLGSIGDCVVVVDDEEIIKCHVHTDNPGNALQEALKYGFLTNMKIENMRQQHANQKKIAESQTARAADEFAYAPVDPSMEYGFVAVAAGDGVKNLFLDLGVTKVVNGGQTMNPSTDDILKAVHAVPAKTVFVLPNNKNIIMAAEQTIKLADRKVCVIQTRTIPQGLSAMLSFDGEADRAQNQLAMTKAMERVGTGQITFAARDSEYDGHKIKKGEILALENNRLAFADKDMVKACVRLTRMLMKQCRDCTFITILYGEDVTEEQAKKVENYVRSKAPDDVEVALINGGQPVYYFIISVE